MQVLLTWCKYLQLGGGLNPPTVLRGFDEIPLAPGESKTVVFNVTRRDISNWDTRAQDWVVNDYDKIAFVGSSSRSFHLNVTLPRVW
jgi:beta-glucosidase